METIFKKSGQKWIKNAKNCQVERVWEMFAVKQRYQTGQFQLTKIGGKCQTTLFN